MIAWLATAAMGGEDHTELEALLGARTAPDAALEQPSEWEPELEPVAVGALLARHLHLGTPVWYGVDATAWVTAPEADATLLALGPRGGWSGSTERWRAELAARVDGQLYPAVSGTSNVRAEALARGARTWDAFETALGVEGVDRAYGERAWSFQTVEPGLTAAAGRSVRVVAGASVQGNQGRQLTDAGSSRVQGGQVRLVAELHATTPHLAAWGAYRLVDAWGGGVQVASRPVFTPVGDYSDDVDALSAGGFLQHRAELGASVDREPWTASLSVLGRLRDATFDDPGSYRRTIHGQAVVGRELGEAWSARLTAGCSGAELQSGAGYLDVYAWVGLVWTVAPREEEDDEVSGPRRTAPTR